MHITTRQPARNGFTLMELLIVCAIVIILAAIVFAFAKNGIKYANSSRDMATMRQVYQTIPLYAGDNAGMLPGPINTGIKAVYPNASASKGRLSYFIASYLGYDNPKDEQFLEAMGFTWQRTQAAKDAPCCYSRESVPLADGSGTIRPFGHPLEKLAENKTPKSMATVFSQIDIARTWAISDLDQRHPDVGNAGWKKDIPAEMSHGHYRIAIYFDGHAGKMNKDNEPM